MIYPDNGATSLQKPPEVYRAVERAMRLCANPGRGGYPAAMRAAEAVYGCREAAGQLFGCEPEQVALTTSCTHGLNIAIRSLVKPGDRVVVSGFVHNGVTRPLYALGARIRVAGRKLFDWEDTVACFARELEAAVNRFVRGLPRRECNVFLRRYFFAEPVAENGKKYGLCPNHVMVILSRARNKLKVYLEKEGYL